VIDATCPLVTKVHLQVLRYAREGFEIVMVGHRGHVEVEGTMGHAPDRMYLVETVADARQLQVRRPDRLAVVTQTTLSVDDTREIIAALQERFPGLRIPAKDDICYATQNRQAAVKAIAARSDLVLILGSRTSSNANRLVEVAKRSGVTARLVESPLAIAPEWLTSCRTVGLSAGASTPELLVSQALARLAELGFAEVETVATADESVRFPLPRPLRNQAAVAGRS
jgi:4-hydroxy-3-methylbut-2-enyl diphosphate reductase